MAIQSKKKRTNADKLRSIPNDMHLAIFMDSVDACPYAGDDTPAGYPDGCVKWNEWNEWNGGCVSCWLDWLTREAESDG